MSSVHRLEAAIAKAVYEERSQPALTDGRHRTPAAEALAASPAALEAARRLHGSPDPLERSVAAHVLGAMVRADQGRAAEAAGILGSMLGRMPDGVDDLHLEWSIADALRLVWNVAAVAPLCSLEGSRSRNVRRSVAEGLGIAMCDQTSEEGMAALLRLTADFEPAVRDWATFSLGSQLDADSREVRAALWARTDDHHRSTRWEAMVGLARRGDARVAALIAAELRAGTAGRRLVEAAAELGGPHLRRLLPGAASISAEPRSRSQLNCSMRCLQVGPGRSGSRDGA
jgi:HEAT repeat protein